jgi:hypothetical protein
MGCSVLKEALNIHVECCGICHEWMEELEPEEQYYKVEYLGAIYYICCKVADVCALVGIDIK